MTLRIRYLSDLHLIWKYSSTQYMKDYNTTAANAVSEFVPWAKEDKDSLLIFAGDIDSIGSSLFAAMLNIVCSRFKYVLVIPGNHDFWAMPIHSEVDLLQRLQLKGVIHPNLYVANGKTMTLFEFDGVPVIAGTYWSSCGSPGSKEEYAIASMRDFSKIRLTDDSEPVTPADLRMAHGLARLRLTKILGNLLPSQSAVVATHFLPSNFTLDPRHSPSQIDEFFCSKDADVYLSTHSSQISHWIFGHTHHVVQKTVYQTELLCNPIGYLNEPTYFDPYAFVEVDNKGVCQSQQQAGNVGPAAE